MAIIISGKETSAAIRAELKKEVEILKDKQGLTPGLAVVIVGSDPASKIYVRNKHRACEEVGMLSRVYEMPEETTEEELLSLVDTLNADPEIHGILVQLPLPKHLDEKKVIYRIDPKKDVDVFHPYNVGLLSIGNYTLSPCTPAGCMELLKRYNIEVSGKECVVLGRSNIVGKPISMLLLQANGTVTTCHSRTKDLKDVCRRADILVAAIGKPKFVGADMVKEGACVIDVGINRLPDGKICGDVDYDAVIDKVSAITPVPGGVGPMTITMLLKNTLLAAKEEL
ncbi:MAG: bifunctional methylenetetrahydrofolate dehydrogenase/methenyltetrahydrofolate cyclohydrolase FolD [Ruminococcaceae bacterium]|nr:bifunctional methylenetetrahydrofolate dehydrogenase/methenyltetrahydrofolate cyclohydrolase FolD [Oscillospiraceae bacterium]